MSCRRTEELDLGGFLSNPAGDEFRPFREHYPACRDCSAEIRVWTELHLELTADADTHPSAEELLRLRDDPAALSDDESSRLADHLSRCASCREELRALEAFAPGLENVALGAPLFAEEHDREPERPTVPFAASDASVRADVPPVVPPHVAAPPPPRPPAAARGLQADAPLREETAAPPPREPEETTGWVRRAGRVVWSPAFAYAAMLLLALPLLFLRRDVVVGPVRQSMAPPAAPAPRAAAPSAVEEELVMRQSIDADPRIRAERAASARRPSGADRTAKKAKPPAEAVTSSDLAMADEAGGRLRALGSMEPPPEAADETPAGLTARVSGEELVIEVQAPARLAPGKLEVRVVGQREREIVEAVSRPTSDAPIRLVLPASWLGAGPYRLEIRDTRGATAEFVVSTARE